LKRKSKIKVEEEKALSLSIYRDEAHLILKRERSARTLAPLAKTTNPPWRVNSMFCKLILTISLTLFLVSFCHAQCPQQPNFHAFGTVALNGNLGYANPSYGGGVGGDGCLSSKVALSADLDLLRVKKNVGGLGFSISGRESIRYFVSRKFFIEGGASESHYSVTSFSKSTVGVLAGAGVALQQGRLVLNADYVHDLSSENRQRVVSLKGQAYAKKHLFLALTVAVSRFQSGGKSQTGVSTKLSAGLWF
jgi:hypothetical protein